MEQVPDCRHDYKENHDCYAGPHWAAAATGALSALAIAVMSHCPLAIPAVGLPWWSHWCCWPFQP